MKEWAARLEGYDAPTPASACAPDISAFEECLQLPRLCGDPGRDLDMRKDLERYSKTENTVRFTAQAKYHIPERQSNKAALLPRVCLSVPDFVGCDCERVGCCRCRFPSHG